MGSAWDLDRVEYNPRCKDIKEAVMIITYIGIFSSTILLIFGLVKMTCQKKRLSFLTKIIIFIFCSEILNMGSRALQFLKYAYDDTRINPWKNDVETPRGIICQIQIVSSIVSDYCSLLGTLLLSFRCKEVIKSKKRFLDKKRTRILLILLIIIISIILSLVFLFVDRYLTRDLFSIKFDLRDRCSYWCWLEHNSSFYCYILYDIILILNIIVALQANCSLQSGYKKLLEQSVVLVENDSTNVLNDNNNSGEDLKEKRYISFDDRKRVDEIRMMVIKCRIYPSITIFIWVLASIYRFIDDIIMREVDKFEDQQQSKDGEASYFQKHPNLRILEEINLVAHTILSSFRGILYGFSFILFEEKIFGNFFKNFLYKCCCKNEDLLDLEENGNMRTTETGVLMSDSIGRESNEDEQNVRNSNTGEYIKNNDMNNSDYHSNE